MDMNVLAIDKQYVLENKLLQIGLMFINQNCFELYFITFESIFFRKSHIAFLFEPGKTALLKKRYLQKFGSLQTACYYEGRAS